MRTFQEQSRAATFPPLPLRGYFGRAKPFGAGPYHTIPGGPLATSRMLDG